MQWLKILLYQAQALGPSYSSWSSEEEHLGTTASAGVGYAYMGGAELGYLLNISICIFTTGKHYSPRIIKKIQRIYIWSYTKL